MKRTAIALALLSEGILAAEPRAPIRIQLETHVLHTIERRLFGQFLERPSWGETGPEIAAGPDGKLSPEVVEMLREMRIPIVRFPGGTDVDYIDWTDMISRVPGRGPERPVTTGNSGEKVTNRFGYDEYLCLAGELGWDSILVVNFLDALAKRKPLAEAARHAAGLVAYVNAPVGAKLPDGMPDWPAIRAQNGHPAPYGVKIFQIGNEWWCDKFPNLVKSALRTNELSVLAPWYRDCIIAYVDAMRAVDPSIEFIIDGRMGHNEESLVLPDPDIRRRVRYLAVHHYAPTDAMTSPQRDGKAVPTEMMKPSDWWLAWGTVLGAYDGEGNCQGFAGGGVLQWRPSGYEIAATEWNWNGWGKEKIDLGGGLRWQHAAAIGTAGFLNGMLRQGEAIRIANQSMLVGHRWGIAAIRVDPTGKLPTHRSAQGAATTFYNLHSGNRLLALKTGNVPCVAQPYRIGQTGARTSVTLLDIVATGSDTAVFVHVVNRSFDADLEAELDCSAFVPGHGRGMLHLLEAVPEDQVAERKGWMSERSQPVEVIGGKTRVAFPRRAVAILEVPRVNADGGGNQ